MLIQYWMVLFFTQPSFLLSPVHQRKYPQQIHKTYGKDPQLYFLNHLIHKENRPSYERGKVVVIPSVQINCPECEKVCPNKVFSCSCQRGLKGFKTQVPHMVRVSGWLSCCTAWVNEMPDERPLLISATHALQEVCSFCQKELSLLT